MVLNVNEALQPIDMKSLSTTKNKVPSDNSFSNTLKEAIAKVNDDQLKADKQTEMLAAGKDIDLHEVMISAQKASVTMETSVQVQKKMLDAYNEIMRMQI